MERSVKFISLSGLAGVMAGIYALAGAAYAYKVIYLDLMEAKYPLLIDALIVLVLSLSTGYLFSMRKAKRAGVPVWGPASWMMLYDISFPLISGGALILVMVFEGYYGLIAPSSLIFYGLALIAGGRHTFEVIRYLGVSEIVLGLICALYPEYGLLAWAAGFGVLHIIYGVIMHFSYDR
ncbi:MAG: hypothetical protein JST14_13095 [Bacteroidetes bacterium]|nr:hypothetical protein [Bacteroidota bacterium]